MISQILSKMRLSLQLSTYWRPAAVVFSKYCALMKAFLTAFGTVELLDDEFFCGCPTLSLPIA